MYPVLNGKRRRARRARDGHVSARTLLAPPPADEALVDAGVDAASRRVREVGGPTDQASYVCQCGYLFAAAVSTTVECPHCGNPQAW
jgi:rubrerythrin